MEMVKSSVRMRITSSSEPKDLLDDLNRVISELIAAEMFVTLVLVSLGKANDLHFATAGHLSILHFRSATGSVCELSTPNPPIGIFKGQEFASSHVKFSSGDIAVLLTDGLTEAANENEDEYGLERDKQQVTKHSAETLQVLYAMLLGVRRKIGKQLE